jgi:hypothetical protein
LVLRRAFGKCRDDLPLLNFFPACARPQPVDSAVTLILQAPDSVFAARAAAEKE